jgi:DNA-binding CsgD family transcriptional regulator/PAS domain-containing protein
MIEALVGQVYEAALSPGLWPETVRRISDGFGAKVGVLHLDRSARSVHGWARGIDPDTWTGRPEDKDPKANPSLRIALAAPLCALIDRRAFIDDAGFDRYPMARNFFAPNRMFHLMVSTLQRDAGSASVLFVARERAQAAFEPGDRAQAAALANHLGRAMRTYRALQLAEARTLAFAQALERLATGVVLTDASLRVLHANPAVERMFEAGDGVGLRLGRLVLSDRRAQRRLELAAAQASEPARRLAEVQFEAWRRGRAPLRVTVLPAVGEAVAVAPPARLLILVGDPEAQDAPRAEALAAAFDLSAAEARVATLAAAAVPTREIAARLGLSENTVKTHLKTVYLKTGARSRAGFVRLALAQAPI